MVSLLIGKKGTGKTKKLIALANEAVAASSGNVVVIEKGAKLSKVKKPLLKVKQRYLTKNEAQASFFGGAYQN